MNKLWTSLALVFAIVKPAYSANSATATVTVDTDIVRDLSISIEDDIVMPDIVKPNSGSVSTVSISCLTDGQTGRVTFSPNGNPFAGGNKNATGINGNSDNSTFLRVDGVVKKGTCGAFIITGEPDFSFSVSAAPKTDGSQTDNGVTLTSVGCVSLQNAGSDSQGLLTDGEDRLRCGASIQVAPGAGTNVSNDYTLGGILTITYD